jgi:hypothetical protein
VAEEEIPKFISKLYDRRSKYLHTGEELQFYKYFHDSKDYTDYDLPSIMGMRSGNRRFDRDDLLPYPSFFITLFREAILNHITKGQNLMEQ